MIASLEVGGVSAGTWLLAVAPVAVLLGLVLWGRLSTPLNAILTVLVAVVVAVAAFGAGPAVVGVGLGKGAWVGVWILYVIWPALLLHHLASRVGMRELGESLENVLPRPVENVLLLAWVLPSFLQGVSGFGTPIAVCAPLLLAIGVDATRAVALPLIGYHWAVGFGSMGSSFYMGALTAHLTPAQTQDYAGSQAVLLGVNVLVSGALVALMHSGWRGIGDGWRVLVTAGPAMVLAQALVVRGEPAIGALVGGTAGLLAILGLRLVLRRGSAGTDRSADRGPVHPARRSMPASGPGAARVDDVAPASRARAAAVPYVVLSVVALAVFVPPALRGWVKSHLLIGPDFPATATSEGTRTAAVSTYNPIALLGHPGTFLLVAAVVSLVVWQARGVWRRGTWSDVRRPGLAQSWEAAAPG